MATRRRTMGTFRVNDIDRDSDAALVAAAKCGDAQAFEELVFRHEGRVFAVAQRITHNREGAEDVVQESFHKAFRHLNDFRENSRFSTWLTLIAINESFMLRSRRPGALEVLTYIPDDGFG